MMELFSSREIAVGIWTVAFLIFILALAFKSRSARLKQSIYGLIRQATKKHMIIFCITTLAYTVIWIKILSTLPLWQWKYLKEIILWVFLIGIPICFNAITSKNQNYFRHVIKSNFKFLVLLEFVIGTFSLSFVTEMILVPFASLLILFKAVSSTDESYKSAEKLFSFLQMVLGYTVLFFAAKNAVQHYIDLNNIDMIISFSIPIVMSFIFIPLSYLYAIYAEYELLVLRMNFKLPKEKKIKRRAKWKTFKSCKLSLKKIQIFQENYLPELYRKMNEKDLDYVFERFRLSSQKRKD